MESMLAAEVHAAREKLQRTAKYARDVRDGTKEEMREKIKTLKEQAPNATIVVTSRIEHRVADLRKEFGEREKQLTRAYEPTPEALQP